MILLCHLSRLVLLTISTITNTRVILFSFKVHCNFERDTCGFVQLRSDKFDWIRRSGKTPSSNTGPGGDHGGSTVGEYGAIVVLVIISCCCCLLLLLSVVIIITV